MRYLGRQAFLSMAILGVLPFLISNRAMAQNTFPTTGNVGIGTTTPSSALYVNDTADYKPLTIQSSDGALAAVRIWNSSNGSTDINTWRVGVSGSNGYAGTAPNVFSISDDAASVKMVITGGSSGNVGIGTTNPGATLEVNGNVKLTSGSGASMSYPDGTVQSTAWNGVLSGGDYAESVNVSGDREKYEPGDVLVIDPSSEGKFLRSSAPYSTAVTGIYSTKPGVVGRRQLTARAHMKEEVPMAMTGIVPTKVSTENGPIKPGDLLVTSSKPGYAMKGTDRTQMLGAVIGKAIGHLDSGVGVIEAVVTLQ
jgi:hypothetical protein